MQFNDVCQKIISFKIKLKKHSLKLEIIETELENSVNFKT